ncbi:SMR family transporter, partial [Pseudomonas aeruginosa]|uniref:SMR family transporter n=1 Tax=Pseudomonas aeruginosa TaxID=287 RepID=UPI003CC6C9A3
FTALAQAVKDIELSLANAIWGGFGILATVAMGWALFGQRLAWRGWLGLLLVLARMFLHQLALRLGVQRNRQYIHVPGARLK